MKRICGLCICLFLVSSFDTNYFRIFTPNHNVKNVFEANYINRTAKAKSRKQISSKERDLIANIVHGESRGEPYEGKVAVASVILNRLDHPNFPKTVEDVIYQKNAFSCIDQKFSDIKPDQEAYKAVDDALSGNDPTQNALFFYNPRAASSKWMKNTYKSNTITIGNHVFFK